MKTTQFTQVSGTHNEYTSDAVKDASGTYVNVADLLDYIEHRLGELKAEDAMEFTHTNPEVLFHRAAELQLLIKELGNK